MEMSLAGDETESERAFDLLRREDMPCNVGYLDRYKGKLALRLHRHHQSREWLLEVGQMLFPTKSDVFDPEPCTMSNAFGDKDWTADVKEVFDTYFVAVLQNAPLPSQAAFNRHSITMTDVQVYEEDLMRKGQKEAFEQLRVEFKKERQATTLDDLKANSSLLVRVPARRLIVDDETIDPDKWDLSSLSFETEDRSVNGPECELAGNQEEWILSLAHIKGSFSGLIGAPGSGKTTVVAKAAILMAQQIDIGRVFITAHSVKVTTASVEKAVEAAEKLGLPLDEIMWMATEQGRKRQMKKSGPAETVMEAINVIRQRKRLLESKPGLYMYLQSKLRRLRDRISAMVTRI